MSQFVTVKEKKALQTHIFSSKIKNWTSYLFVIPSLVFILLFMIFPIAYNLLLSFKNVTIMNLSGVQEFVGWANYITIFNDPVFAESLKNSIIFTTLCIGFQFVAGFALALFFNQSFPGRDIMRSMLLLAWMMPIVITATLFNWMLAGDHGIVNYVLIALGILDKPVLWLSETSTSLYGTIISNIWIGIPFNMIILLAALQSLPEQLYEAARIDGAGRFRQFYHITLPLLKPTIMILLMLGIIYTFKVFDLIFIMTSGGPVNSSTVLPLYAYRLAFTQFEFSLGAVVASIMFVILVFLSMIYLWMIRKEEQL